jgi:hypothetical protein
MAIIGASLAVKHVPVILARIHLTDQLLLNMDYQVMHRERLIFNPFRYCP